MKLFYIFLLLLLENEKCWKWLFRSFRICTFIFSIILLGGFWLSLLLLLLNWLRDWFLWSCNFNFFLWLNFRFFFLLWLMDRNRFLFWLLLSYFLFNWFVIAVFDCLISHKMSADIVNFLESLTQDLRDFVKGLDLIHFNNRL